MCLKMIAEADMCFLRFFEFNLLVFRRLTKPMERGGSGECVFAATAKVERWRGSYFARLRRKSAATAIAKTGIYTLSSAFAILN